MQYINRHKHIVLRWLWRKASPVYDWTCCKFGGNIFEYYDNCEDVLLQWKQKTVSSQRIPINYWEVIRSGLQRNEFATLNVSLYLTCTRKKGDMSRDEFIDHGSLQQF